MINWILTFSFLLASGEAAYGQSNGLGPVEVGIFVKDSDKSPRYETVVIKFLSPVALPKGVDKFSLRDELVKIKELNYPEADQDQGLTELRFDHRLSRKFDSKSKKWVTDRGKSKSSLKRTVDRALDKLERLLKITLRKSG